MPLSGLEAEEVRPEEFDAADRLLALLQGEREEWAKDNSRLNDRYRDHAQAILIEAYRAHARELRAVVSEVARTSALPTDGRIRVMARRALSREKP